jgi:hypothetical protein
MANQIMKKSTGASDKMYPIFSMSMSWLRAVLLCCQLASPVPTGAPGGSQSRKSTPPTAVDFSLAGKIRCLKQGKCFLESARSSIL